MAGVYMREANSEALQGTNVMTTAALVSCIGGYMYREGCCTRSAYIMHRITDAICTDHRNLESYYDRIADAQDSDEQTRYQNQFTWELARHVVGEELVLYPALEAQLPDGDTGEDRQQQHTIKEKLAVFQNLSCSDPRFIPTLTILMEDLSAHIHIKEMRDLVKLEGAITAEESERLARSFDRTKFFAPTRAHPGLPDRPYVTAAALIAAPLDRLQDLFQRWPEDGLTPIPDLE